MRRLPGLDLDAFLAALDAPAVRAFRVNTLKTDAEHLFPLLPFAPAPIPFAPNAFFAPDDKVGGLAAHHAGGMYMQDPSAIFTVLCADLAPDARVADLCAAPGGKSTQLAAMIPDGILLSNEYVPERCRILQGNIERLGIKNAVVTNLSTADIAKDYGAFFDFVLVDAPCSGEGMFRKYPIAVSEWSVENVRLCAKRQREILENAAALTRSGGKLLYSTCTFSVEENEENIDNFLSAHKDFSLLPVPASLAAVSADGITLPSFSHDMSPARRFYPHLAPGEGQFVALLQRSEEGMSPLPKHPPLMPISGKDAETVSDFLQNVLQTSPSGVPICLRDTVYLAPALPLPSRGVFAAGVAIGTLAKNRLIPHHHFFSAYGADFRRRLRLAPDDVRLARYLAGEEIDAPKLIGNDGFAAVFAGDIPLGGGKAVAGRLKNHYPKGLRSRA